MKPRGRRIVLAAAVLGLLTLAGFALKDRAVEEWWLHRLESGNQQEKLEAAERLGKLKSRKTVPLLLEELEQVLGLTTPICRIIRLPRGGKDYEVSGVHPYAKSIAEIGVNAVPDLISKLQHQNAAVRRNVIWALEEIGPATRERYREA